MKIQVYDTFVVWGSGVQSVHKFIFFGQKYNDPVSVVV